MEYVSSIPTMMVFTAQLLGTIIVLQNILVSNAQVVRGGTTFCTQLVIARGYRCLEYKVQTEDGYALVMHRIGTMLLDFPGTFIVPDQDTNEPSVAPSLPPLTVTPIDAPSLPPLMVAPIDAVLPFTSYNDPSTIPGNHIPIVSRSNHPVSADMSSAVIPFNLRRKIDISLKDRATQSEKLPETATDHRTAQNTISDEKADDSISTARIKIDWRPHDPNVSRIPILLIHPEFLNGDSWFQTIEGEERAQVLPLMLVDAGYDVWVGHQRATYWGHDHVTLDPSSREYWNWTWDQHAQFDLPALLWRINAETNQLVHYVGLSQGATVGAAAATRADMGSLLKSLTLIGPTIYRGTTNLLVLGAWDVVLGADLSQRYVQRTLSYEGFNLSNDAFNFTSEFPSQISQAPILYAMNTISGPSCCMRSTQAITPKNAWDGTTSVKNMLHMQQGIQTNTWRKFDYGNPGDNMNAFNGSQQPPSYDPTQIPDSLPVLVIYGTADETSRLEGVYQFISSLRSPAQTVQLANYAHLDLIYSVNRSRDVYRPIIQFLAATEF